MQAKRAALSFFVGFALLGSGSLPPFAKRSVVAQEHLLPELLYTCPMHADVLDEKPGGCPVCKMRLKPVRIETEFWYACPLHPVTLTPAAGVCPIDKKRQKMPVVVTVHWTCKQSPDQELMEPGRCEDGSNRQQVHEIRAHGDHNPRHGGQFYMAADNWHHVEGTYPRQGLFRTYFYDNFTQPIDVKHFSARLVREDQADILLKPVRDNTMEGAIKDIKTPLKLTLKVKFGKDRPESQFDFTFTELSKEPASAPTTTTAAGTSVAQARVAATAATTARDSTQSTRTRASSTNAGAGGGATPAAGSTPTAGVTAAPAPASTATTTTTPPVTVPLPQTEAAVAMPTLTNCEPNVTRTDLLLLSDALPKDTKALFELLSMCSAEVQKLIDSGQFGFVYQPTILGKDIALALDEHVRELPERRRRQATDAIRRTVLSAWQLDLYGDLGNQTKLTEAYNLFTVAIADIKSAYDGQP